MNNSFTAEHSNDTQQTPAWSLTVLLTGAACAVLRFGDVWSWWTLLWAPLLATAVGFMVHEWRVLARNHWRMRIIEWLLLTVAHLGCVAAVALILGL
ncbi:hypothetical protein NLX86_13210 [Streptomyces sp. A3M-1-3]|uniref:hypothetical protein n=1 Tax=Streptomyces sp. A3M-1-3 TaxID=2962044 RepID=UPI0020B7DD59|nr:hypothetical protein [Streptomyces sp. A3M-1-3]MCP3819039.1 hypothetical protein [Streptomyces sp. A3M-1-3]